jgi:hypothetical protein
MERNECSEILEERHCDVACREIRYVENLHTSAGIRHALCKHLMEACLDPATLDGSELDSCGAALRSALEKAPELDRQLASCADCIEQTRVDASLQTMETPITGAQLCGRFITRCEDTCSQIGVVAEALAKAEARFALLETVAKACSAHFACIPDGDPNARVASCSATIRKQLDDEMETLLPILATCTSCLELTSCEVATRSEDCAGKCGTLKFTE